MTAIASFTLITLDNRSLYGARPGNDLQKGFFIAHLQCLDRFRQIVEKLPVKGNAIF